MHVHIACYCLHVNMPGSSGPRPNINSGDMYDENTQCWEKGRHKRIAVKKVPLGARLLSYLGVFNCYPPKR